MKYLVIQHYVVSCIYMIFENIKKFIFPSRCVLCDKLLPYGDKLENIYLCDDCKDKFEFIKEPTCKKCGAMINNVEGAVISISVGYPIVCLALMIPNICVIVRRLHDTGHSGFWYFITLVPLIGAFWFLYLMIKDSDDENEYGLPVY